MNNVAIVNYGMGNLTSVRNAIAAVGGNPVVVSDPSEFVEATHLILPGVGAFGDVMKNLRRRGWIDLMYRHAIEQRKPFLGICLGMQLLAETGTEHGAFEGLGWVPGQAAKLTASNVRVPHIGWNDVEFTGETTLLHGIDSGHDFYFVHSYALRPSDESCVTGWCYHGERFAATIQQENIFATQFHPEKSQKAGLRILKNFIEC